MAFMAPINPSAHSSHPPKARLALRIGVTGHRLNKLKPEDEAPLRAGIRAVLKFIRDTATNLGRQKDLADVYEQTNEPLLRVISPLAEGADRFVAQEGLALGYRLQCPLPFAREEYARDFSSTASRDEYYDLLAQAETVFELDGARSTPETPEQSNSAYQVAGRRVLNHADILIAIWDGKQPNGVGGAGQMVREARALSLPVVWINATAPYAIKLQIQDEFGQLQTFELSELETSEPNKLGRQIERLLAPPTPQESDLRDAYFTESARCYPWQFNAFNLFSRLLGAGPRRPPEPAPGPSTAYDDHYRRADQLAGYYSDRYRNAFLMSYLLSSVAVLFAALSALLSFGSGTDAVFGELVSIGIVFGELVSIGIIYLLIRFGRRGRWHERWIDYRLLAEELRPMQFLAPLGLTTPALRLPPYDAQEDLRSSWINWLPRAISRETGLLNASSLDLSHLTANHDRLIAVITGQVNYHEYNSERYHLIAERLHTISKGLFLVIFIACIIHLITHNPVIAKLVSDLIAHDLVIAKLASGIAIVLPAFGAALAGILGQGEFERIAKRSKAMAEQLKTLVEQLRTMPQPLSSQRLGNIAQAAAEIMTSEVLDWRVVFRSRPLVLPT